MRAHSMAAAPTTSLTLVLPSLFTGLTLLEDGAQSVPDLPGLNTLLARADVEAGPLPVGLEARLFTLFGVPAPADGDWPVAAVTRFLDMGVIDNDWWIRADPVHLQADRDRLILVDAAALKLTQDEAHRLLAEIQESYRTDGWLFKAPRPERWYLKPPAAAQITTTALPEVVARNIQQYLPAGVDGKAWHTLLNETQILLHAAQANAEREAQGKLPVNSLWFWGGGRLPRLGEVRWAKVHSNEAVGQGLARLARVPVSPVPDTLDTCLGAAPTGPTLVVLDAARPPVLYSDAAAWSEALRMFDGRWVRPAIAALQSARLESVTVLADTGPSFTLRRSHRWRFWRFWRPRRPLTTYTAFARDD
jgi:hypothetical protein